MRNDLLVGVFEPEASAAMGEAFDAACMELPVSSRFEGVRELIAALIIGPQSGASLTRPGCG
jgi:hypothetical protein